MPWTLARYVVSDLLRTIALTTGVLVTVIAFGAAAKPLASGGLTPGDFLRYVGYAIIPMLQFALPFAAGFGATLVLHRMASDNEVLAASASGLSHGRFFLPVLLLGVVLSVTMLWLSHYVIPYFWVRMEKTVAKDVARLLQASIAAGEAFKFDDIQIFARDVRVIDDPPDSDARARLILTGVAAAELDQNGAIVTDVTSRVAVADIFDREGATIMTLALTDTVVYDSGKGTLGHFPRLDTQRPFLIPTPISDDPKLMSLPRILEIRRDPETFGRVIRARTDLAQKIQEIEIWNTIEERITATQQLIVDEPETGATFILRGERFRGHTLTRAGVEPVVIEELRDGLLARTITCRRVDFEMSRAGAFGTTFKLRLDNCVIERPDGTMIESANMKIPGTLIRGLQDDALIEMSSAELLEYVRHASLERQVRGEVEMLHTRITDIQAETIARLEQRNAQSVTALLLLMLGALLGTWLREMLPLAIYILAFFPAIVDLMIISGGEQMMRDGNVAGGRAVIWSGNAIMLLLILIVYARLSRN